MARLKSALSGIWTKPRLPMSRAPLAPCPREAEFRQYDTQRQRNFTATRGDRTITHTGPADQALIHEVWPTRDDRDPQEKQVLNMLQRVLRIQLTETLRQKLGRSYSPAPAAI
jgi:zinc protease